MRLVGRLVETEDLSHDDRRQMLALMQRHYENVCPDLFLTDLAEKQWVIEVRHSNTGRLCGFSTQMLLHAEIDGQPIRALFSGDTIIDRDHWGDPTLSHMWGRLALELADAFVDCKLYWFLVSQGYKTYRFLPLFFREFHPRAEVVTPEWARDAIGVFAAVKFGEHFDAAAGVVRAHQRQYRLAQGVADLTVERMQNADVRFFASVNPAHAQGDELCCIAPLSRANFTAAAYRVIGPEPIEARAL